MKLLSALLALFLLTVCASASAARISPARIEGDENYDTTLHIMSYCNGTSWTSMGSTQWTASGSNVYYNTGNVGIGTTAPWSSLDVRTQSNTNFIVWGSSNLGSNTLELGNTNDANNTNMPMEFSASKYNFAIGNVGIGVTSPGASLESAGTIKATGYASRSGSSGSYSGNNFNIYWSGSTAYLYIDTTQIGAFAYASDRRLKKNIEPLKHEEGLEALLKLNPVTFNWRNPNDTKDIQYGLIAQDVQNVLPNLVHNTGLKSETTPGGTLKIEYNGLFAPIIKSVQQLKSLFDSDHDRVNAELVKLQAANDNEAAEIKELRAEIEQLKAAKH